MNIALNLAQPLAIVYKDKYTLQDATFTFCLRFYVHIHCHYKI